MAEKEDGILWRIARLHPAWMTLPVTCLIALVVAPGFLGVHGREAVVAASIAAWGLSVIVILGHILLVIAQTSGRFYSRRPRRLIGPAFAVLVLFAAPVGDIVLGDAIADRGERIFGAIALFVLATFYLQIKASVDLVEAERGFGGGTGQKIGTYLLFGFWIAGAFFIQARIRKLAMAFAEGGPVALPREKLDLVQPKPGTFALC